MKPKGNQQRNMTPLKKWGICSLLAITALSTSAFAQTYNFTAFETGGISDPTSLSPIKLKATLSQNGTSLDVVITNESQPGDGWVTSSVPTVTKIAFDDGAGVLPSPTFANNPPNVVFNADNSVNIPGSNNIGFVTTYGFNADPPPTTTGIDPGEQFIITFANTSVSDAVKAFEGGALRIAAQVQQIGRNDESASFVTVVPEPSTTLLASMAGMLVLLRRKR